MGKETQGALVKSAEEARSIAERSFTMRYPDHLELFDTTWDVLVRRRASLGGGSRGVTSELAVTGSPDNITVEMVKIIGIFFETLVTKSPLVREEVAERLKSICRKNGEDQNLTDALAESLVKAMANERLMLVVKGTRNGHLNEQPDVGESMARQQSDEQGKVCDISVWENKVTVKETNGKSASVRKVTFRRETNIFRTFVVMLRYRGKPLPTRWFYMATRRPAQSDIANLFDEDLSEDLRFAIRDVEKKLGVSYFYTPDKNEGDDYICAGEFSFILVIPMSLAKELSLPL